MGLNQREDVTYLSCGDGKIVQRAQKDTPGAKERTTKEGKVVYEKLYSSISGKLTDIKVKDNEYGKFWMLYIVDGTDKFCLQLQYSSRYAGSMFCALPNADLSKDIEFKPYMKIEDDKKKVTMFLNQEGKSIKWAFTKDNPGDLPPMVKAKVKGKVVWDDSDRMEYFEKMVNNEILPKLKGNKSETFSAKPQAIAEEENDLPF